MEPQGLSASTTTSTANRPAPPPTSPSKSSARVEPPSKKRIRKSRSRGLRTKTGCLTCRKRHKKCDETRPVCGPCSISSRECVYAAEGAVEGIPITLAGRTLSRDDSTTPATAGEPGPTLGPAARSVPSDATSSKSQTSKESSIPIISSPHSGSLYSPAEERPPATRGVPGGPPSVGGSESYHYGYSPETVTSDAQTLTADLASTRWLDLLATDAAEADGGFSLAASPVPDPFARSQHEGFEGVSASPAQLSFGIAADNEAAVTEKHAWQADEDIELSAHEAFLFRNFAERAATWLDVLDPLKSFSTHATRLALRNTGLMKAILALASRRHAMIHMVGVEGPEGMDPNESIQYYYETLHYVQTALKYNSYAHSEELLGTALVISTYEMLNAADSNWQRHLKGVFWIQRSQDVNGDSGGLRQAVWWAWLRQDLWAAFRERRRCFSFWRPVRDYTILSQDDLAKRSIYLLSQTVNYCANPDASSTDPDVLARRTVAGDTLLDMLERWRSFLGPKFRSLPTVAGPSDVFEPIWIHPPQFGAALQAYNFARILITLHSPPRPGFDGYLKTQKILSDAVATICGIAMELKDEGCQILSSQCLFGAGLCVQDDLKRNTIITLINACEARTGWPMAALREDLRAEWARAV